MVSADGETIAVHIPMTFRKRGGRKLVVTPDGEERVRQPRVDNTIVQALSRAFRWRKMLTKVWTRRWRNWGVNSTYVSRGSAVDTARS
jgi:hypothetical protein